ncbi:MAG: hypothetical protein R3F56_19255 [Planctomycetota bacterium]
MRSSPPAARLFGSLALLGAALYGAWRAVALFWCSDDAFISFRYAKNLNDGLGLVFNAGEHVEGYTNFSWTMLVAAAMRLGADPVVFTQWAGLACFLGTLALLAWLSRRIAPDAPFVPVAAVAFALHEHGQVFASGGLETSLFTLLATGTVGVAAVTRGRAGFLLAGALGAAASMTRPDGILLFGVAGLVALWRSRQSRSAAPFALVAAPGLLVYLPYWVWRYLYYGWPFPNTFYAKSAASAYPQQGLYYLGLYLGCYFVLALLPLGLAAGWSRARTRLLASAVALAVTLYAAFVAWVGGDFMFARFLVPITPLAYLGIELLRVRLGSMLPSVLLVLVVGAATVLRRHPGEEVTRLPGGARGVVEERLNYTPETTAAMRSAGEQLRVLFAGHAVRVVIMGAQAVLAYYGEFALAIEGCTGLTDEHIAHMPLAERKAVGHEKSVLLDPGYLLQRRVHFSLHLAPDLYAAGHYQHIRFGPSIFGVVITYDPELMRALRSAPGVECVDFESYLDDYLVHLGDKGDDVVRADYAKFKTFYFDHVDDQAREEPLRRRLGLR